MKNTYTDVHKNIPYFTTTKYIVDGHKKHCLNFRDYQSNLIDKAIGEECIVKRGNN